MSVPVALRLRPLEVGDLLDETFRMYRRHFILFAGISVLLSIPSAALFGLALGSFTSVLQQTNGTLDDTSFLTPLLAAFAAGLAVNLVILPFTMGAVMYAACESAVGRPVTAGAVVLGAFLLSGQFRLQLFVPPFIAAAIAAASGQIVGAVVNPILQIAIVLVYFDLRVRKEGLDLFQMAYRLSVPVATS